MNRDSHINIETQTQEGRNRESKRKEAETGDPEWGPEHADPGSRRRGTDNRLRLGGMICSWSDAWAQRPGSWQNRRGAE